jgi:hypothetical protein
MHGWSAVNVNGYSGKWSSNEAQERIETAELEISSPPKRAYGALVLQQP